jgi:hypothetical protein
LESLARTSIGDSEALYHRAVSVIHQICEALTNCEASAVPDALIRDVSKSRAAIRSASGSHTSVIGG